VNIQKREYMLRMVADPRYILSSQRPGFVVVARNGGGR
jgi:hypothetical protein